MFPIKLFKDDMEKEEKLLLDAFFNKDGASIAKSLSDAITSSLEDKQHVAATGFCLLKSFVFFLFFCMMINWLILTRRLSLCFRN